MSKRGRPTKFDDLRAKRIVDAIAEGNSRRCAAGKGGVHLDTLMTWLARGRTGDPEFVEFAERVQRADADAEAKMVAVVRKAAESGTWQAGAWWLERSRQQDYALRREARSEEIGVSSALSAEADSDIIEAAYSALQSRKASR